MHNVYAHALFTVAAAHASDGSFGCNTIRDPSLLSPLVLRVERPNTLSTWLSSLVSTTVISTEPPDGEYICQDATIWRREIDESPMAGRAWIAQERFLSHRVLFFGRTQLFFGCSELRACESYPLGCPKSILADDIFTGGLALLRRLNLEAGVNDKTNVSISKIPAKELVDAWCSLVESYTTFDVKYFGDKLPAISGIAQRIAPYMSSEMGYSCGLWTGNRFNELTVRQLIWFTDVPKPRPTDVKAPSWSWASVATPVVDPGSLDPVSMASMAGDPTALEASSTYFRMQCAYCVGQPKIEPEGPSLYGKVKKAVIWLSGLLIPATIKLHDMGGSWGTELVLEMRECSGSLGGFNCRLDTSDVDLSGSFVCVPMQQVYDGDGFVRLFGLILRIVKSVKGRYQRVGMFWTIEEEFRTKLAKPITDVEAKSAWCEKMDKSPWHPDMDRFIFHIE